MSTTQQTITMIRVSFEDAVDKAQRLHSMGADTTAAEADVTRIGAILNDWLEA